jgi:hypothetical protein
MTTTAPIRLEPLSLIRVEAVPHSRRQEIATREESRKMALGDAMSLVALGTTCAGFALAYLSGSVYLLMRSMYFLGVSAMIVYFGLGFIACVVGDKLYKAILERRRLAIDEPLRLEAAAESALAEAATRLNGEAAAWNECVRLASDANLEGMDDVLIVMRDRISAQLVGYETRLGCYVGRVASAQITGPPTLRLNS